MPILHENKNQWIYDAYCNGKFKYNSELELYTYSNPSYPHRKYTKTFDPKFFMSRGDVIHFGNDTYRNNNKLIFDGKELLHLYTEIDDYGSVPPTFVVGDEPGDFNIGDFENLIDHNSINWLSKDKLKEIQIYHENGNIYGKVVIRNELYTININLPEDYTFHTAYFHGSVKKINCYIVNDIIKFNEKNNFLIKTKYDEDDNKLKNLIKENNNINIATCTIKSSSSTPASFSLMESLWFAYNELSTTKLIDITNNIKFPILWKNLLNNYNHIINDLEHFEFLKFNYTNQLDYIYITEIIGYPIIIEEIKKNINELINDVQNKINKSIENYDDINKRLSFNRESKNILEIYL
jgi:hypothetical protein